MLLLRSFLAVLCTALFTMSYTVRAQTADSPQIIEGFGCNFLPGKGFDDLDGAIDFYKEQISKINSPELHKQGSVLWVPYRGNVAVDFVWVNTNMTLNDWGKSSAAYDGSAAGQAADARFFESIECPSSALATTETLLATDKQFEGEDEVVIESYRCQLQPGKTIADSDAAIAAWSPVFAKAVESAGSKSLVMRRLPLISGGGFDLTYAAIWSDTAAYARANSAFQADPDSAKSGQLFAAAHSCDSAMFKGRVVVPWDN